MSDLLPRLAEAHGIALEYLDVWGRPHRVTEATLRALLAAMGVVVETDADAEQVLSARTEKQRRRTIAPAVVVRYGERAALWVNRRAAPDTQGHAWRLVEETGAEYAGELMPMSHRDEVRTKLADEVQFSRQFLLPHDPPPGYHRLSILSGDEVLGETLLIVAPATCYRPSVLDGAGRVWGPAVQLYALRSARNWGIGDFTDLAAVVEQWVARGAGVIATNPLHALFPDNAAHASPYSPSSRLFLNVLYLDVEAIDDFQECEEARSLVASAAFQTALGRVRNTDLVDYVGVAQLKGRALTLTYRHFRTVHLAAGDARAGAFRAFCTNGDGALRQHALFEALQEHLVRQDPSIHGWQAWPEAFRDPCSAAVQRFAAENAERVEYYQYLQWQAALQLAAVVRRSSERGAGIGLCADLAVSIARAGAEAWGNQKSYAVAASVGAPPDEFNLRGQDWGLPPLVPERLRDTGYAPFIAMLRANMRHAGALRIDHVMGLQRLFWIPAGAEPAAGAYVHYPFADLLGILALESHRHRCLIVGEDLGTVAEDLRDGLAQAGVLSTRLLLFEREPSREFKPPAAYPAQAIVAATTHDLPTLAGWWEARDLALRAELGLFPNEATREQQVAARAEDRARLLRALEGERLLPPGVSTDPASLPAMTSAVALAVHAFLARTPAQLMLVQLEDVIGVREQANLPATVIDYPNWRRKLPLAPGRWVNDERFVELVRTLQRERLGAGVQPALKRRDRVAVAAGIPRATYRLQLHRGFTFADATALVPYLATLGVSHVYCSPYLRARAGSRHGYDIVDHSELNPEIGSREHFERFVAALAGHGMGQIADVVPNHMGIMGADNAWWMDLLENGPASRFADYFDIDWHPLDPDLAGKVLVPVLGDHYGRVLERGELSLAYEPEAGAFAVHYQEHRLPVDPREYPRVLERALEAAGAALTPEAGSELAALIAAFRQLPPRTGVTAAQVEERRRDKELFKARLATLSRQQPPLAEAIGQAQRQLNGSPGEPESFAALHALLEAQAYRVAYWRVAADEINYRRFFDVNDLAALRMEDPAVFEATHRYVLELAAAGKVHGLRIDHPDGLYDPAAYFRRLQEFYSRLSRRSEGTDERALYVVIEKIDAAHEQLPASWRVHGTTGYRFANLLAGIFVESAAKGRIDRTWRAFVGAAATDFDEVAYLGRRLIMRSALLAELTVLANRLLRIARADRRTRDLTLSSLWQALAEITACFPVYRTYVAQRVSAQDRRYVDWAVGRARRRSRSADASVFAFVRDVLLLQPPQGSTTQLQHEYRAFAMRFQQFTAPVMAKGVEDTAFYGFNRLVSLNEVGGDPGQFGTTVKAFHRANTERLARWPHALLAAATHDNKRSADVRARIAVISEMPAVWRRLVRHWSRMNRRHKRMIDDTLGPSRNDEYLLYQTLIGTFPVAGPDAAELGAYRQRIERYMVKAAREAKVSTSWMSVDEEYESALTSFVTALLRETATNAFLPELRATAPAFAWFGALNSVAMALLHCTSPGVPDIYQGNELIDLSLVDPDNRRPVDYERRRELVRTLEILAGASPEERASQLRAMLASPHDGRLKLWVIARALRLRREQPELFASGDYVPVSGAGARSRHVVAYARLHGEVGFVALGGRLFASLGLEPGVGPVGARAWDDTRLELPFAVPGGWMTDVLTGQAVDVARRELALATVFTHLPCALLAW